MIRFLFALFFYIAIMNAAGCVRHRVEPIVNRAIDPSPELRERFAAAAKEPDLLTISLARAECVPGGLAIWLNLSGPSIHRVVHIRRVVFSQVVADIVGGSETFEVLDASGRVVEWTRAELPAWMAPELEEAARNRPLLSSPPTYISGSFIQPPLKTSVDGVVSQLLYISVPNAAPGFVVRLNEDPKLITGRIEGRLESLRQMYGLFERFEILNRTVVVQESKGEPQPDGG